MFRQLLRLFQRKPTPVLTWHVMFRGHRDNNERLGIYTGSEEEALECAKAWLAVKAYREGEPPCGVLELRPMVVRTELR